MNNTDKVYPQVDDVPDNVKKEWLNNVPQSSYTKFQEWQNDCPVKILDYHNGKTIKCPNCSAPAHVFLFSWSAITCQFCSSDINKEDWLIITQSPNLSEVSDFFYSEIRCARYKQCSCNSSGPLTTTVPQFLKQNVNNPRRIERASNQHP